MTHYRIPELDLSTRISLGLDMLRPIPEREWGWATQLAEQYNISRTLLYKLRDQAEEALHQAFSPQPPGPAPAEEKIVMDRDFIRRSITVLSLMKGSIRDIQWGLELLFGETRSVGYISETLQEVGKAAANYNDSLRFPLPMLGELDEIFQGRKPCLTVVDARSFLVLNLTAAEHRDGTTWGVTLLNLQERGIRFHDLVSDGAKGIQAGVEAAELAVPLRPDLFHVIREAHPISRRLERAAYQALQTTERARRAERERKAPQRRRGRPLEVEVSVGEAAAAEEAAIDRYDHWHWLWHEARCALEPLTPTGELRSPQEARETVEVALELLQELGHEDCTEFTLDMLASVEELLAPLRWLEACLTPWRQAVEAETEALILWAWQHRQALDLEPGEGFPEALQPVVQAYWEILDLFHRASSLAESLHSWLRPYLHIHRGMPPWLLPLLTLFWNHHTFSRGKRAGKSPLELAGVEDVRSLSEVLTQLVGTNDQHEPETVEDPKDLALLELFFSSKPAQVAV